jgi:hypothetical protein
MQFQYITKQNENIVKKGKISSQNIVTITKRTKHTTTPANTAEKHGEQNGTDAGKALTTCSKTVKDKGSSSATKNAARAQGARYHSKTTTTTTATKTTTTDQ